MSLIDLQKEADSIFTLAPILSPNVIPESSVPDLLSLAEEEGDEGAQALLEVLAGAGEEVNECELCGEEGELALAPENENPESVLLRPTFTYRPCYAEQKLIPESCQFLCGLCRQIRGTSNLLQEIISSQGYEDQDLVEGLLEHLADVNEIPNAIDNPEICFAWGYRLLMRAYALQIACGSNWKWTIVNSDRSDIENWKPGSSANIALQLLMPSLSKVERDKAIKSALNQNNVGQIENSGHINASNNNLRHTEAQIQSPIQEFQKQRTQSKSNVQRESEEIPSQEYTQSGKKKKRKEEEVSTEEAHRKIKKKKRKAKSGSLQL